MIYFYLVKILICSKFLIHCQGQLDSLVQQCDYSFPVVCLRNSRHPYGWQQNIQVIGQSVMHWSYHFSLLAIHLALTLLYLFCPFHCFGWDRDRLIASPENCHNLWWNSYGRPYQSMDRCWTRAYMSSIDVAVSLSQLRTCIFRWWPAEDHCSGTKAFVSEYLIEAHMFDCCDCSQLIAGTRAEWVQSYRLRRIWQLR
jgi:hypothetical protein